MAHATAETRFVPASETVTVTLTLSEAEAGTLQGILAKISGDPLNSPRRHAHAIQVSLGNALNRDWSRAPEWALIRNPTSVGLFFEDYPQAEA